MQRRSRHLVLVAGALLLALSTPPPAGAEAIYVQAAAHMAGAFGSMWLTDLEVQNVTGASVTYTVAYLASNQDNSTPPTATFSLPAGAAVRHADVLASLFGLTSGLGALRLTSPGEELRVTGRTYNQGTSGTSGQLVPGQRTRDAFASGEDAVLMQLTKNSAYRSNIGYVNTTGSAIALETTCYSAAGAILGTLANSLQPFSMVQRNDVFGYLGVTTDDAYCRVSTTTAGGRFLTYSSCVDNMSGDAWLAPGQREPVSAEPLYLPFAAHDATRRSDLEVKAAGSDMASFELAWLPSATDNSAPAAFGYVLDAGTSVRFVDVVQSAFGAIGTGALRVTPTIGNVLVTSRTYYSGMAGTLSAYVPARAASAAFPSAQTATVFQLTRSADFSSHVGLVNTTGLTVEVSVALYNASGGGITTLTPTVLPYGHVQLEDAFGTDVADGFALVRCTTDGGRVLPYATVVDLRTDDAIHVPGQLYQDSAALFGDGFESGDTTAWSVASP